MRGYHCLLASALFCASALHAQQDESLANYFEVPYAQVTQAIAACPAAQEPRISRSEMLAQSHYRAERGNSCYQAGRCRLPNAYLYDKEIIPRVQKAIVVDGRFANTSVWVEGQRRWVWLHGCVADAAQARALEELVQSIDDVQAVINELRVLPTAQEKP